MIKGIRIQFCFALFCALFVSLSVFAQSSDDVKIGNQIWMSKNLDVDRFRNGDLIPHVTSKEQWEEYGKQKKPAWCYYKNNSDYGPIYGKLYNGYAVIDPRGLAPDGYRIPTHVDFTELVSRYEKRQYYTGETIQEGLGSSIIEHCQPALSSTTGWSKVLKEIGNTGPTFFTRKSLYGYVSLNGNNKSNFNAFPAGCRLRYGSFSDGGVCTKFWGSPLSCYHTKKKYSKELYPNCPNNCPLGSDIGLPILLLGNCGTNAAHESSSNLEEGRSVRCIKN